MGAAKLVGQKHTHDVCDTCKHCVECIDALELLGKKLAFDLEAARKTSSGPSRRKPCSGFGFDNHQILEAPGHWDEDASGSERDEPPTGDNAGTSSVGRSQAAARRGRGGRGHGRGGGVAVAPPQGES